MECLSSCEGRKEHQHCEKGGGSMCGMVWEWGVNWGILLEETEVFFIEKREGGFLFLNLEPKKKKKKKKKRKKKQQEQQRVVNVCKKKEKSNVAKYCS